MGACRELMYCHQPTNAAPASPCPRLGALLVALMFPDGDLLCLILTCPLAPMLSPLVLHMCFSFSLSPLLFLLLLAVLCWLGCNNNPPSLTPLLPLLVWVFSPIILLIFCP